jgi:3-deoxy-manno-octulosonate cytidylyltransferase (CMP-KDO synthetase)
MANPLLVIPARVNSSRLPGKVLADIEGKPMITRVYERCLASQAGPILVACDGPEVAWEIEKIGGQVCLTDPRLPSGSDRVHAAVASFDPDGNHDIIVCVQGDLPTLEPELIRRALYPLEENPHTDIATLATLITDEDEVDDPNIVKIALAASHNPFVYRALYFSRSPIPAGRGPKYHHIGLYAYRRSALERFVNLLPSPLESQEKLEQLRALEAGMRIDVTLVNTVPLGVDTADDLIAARKYYQQLV